MSNTAVFFGSTTGNTESVAKIIAEKVNADVFDVSKNPTEKLSTYNNLIFGASTWGVGDLQDDWETFITELENANLNDKIIALFGLGDSQSYPDSFVDAIGTIFESIKGKGCKIVGGVDTEGYSFDDSKAVYDGKFVGLPLDEDNESDQSDERINKWIEQIKQALV